MSMPTGNPKRVISIFVFLLTVLISQVTSSADVTPVSERTSQVRDAIVAAVPGVDNAADVTEAHLAAITELNFLDKGITSLKSGDFHGLSSLTLLRLTSNNISSLPEDIFGSLSKLTELHLDNVPLSSLPENIFEGLSSLTTLFLAFNGLTSIPEDVFNGLTSLTELGLSSNPLGSLPAGLFDGLSSLQNLYLWNNFLTSLPADLFDGLSSLKYLGLDENLFSSLPADIFDNLTALTTLSLRDNDFSSLPADMFDNLTALTTLNLNDNQLTALPDGIFEGLTGLTSLLLSGNTVDPLPLTLSLEKVADGQFKAVAPTGAPFDIVLPLTVTNGSINGGATTLTIPAGSVESGVLTVTRTTGATFAVSVDIGTLQELPAIHDGYTLVKSTDLPLVFAELGGSVFVPVSNRTSVVAEAILGVVRLNYPTVSSYTNITRTHLTAPTALYLNNRSITALKSGDFDGLINVSELRLQNNQLTALPADIFSGLTSLSNLNLYNNQLSSLPDGIFEGLTSLTTIRLGRNTVNPLPFAVSLEKVGDNQVKAVTPAGAMFDIVLPLTVTNGAITGATSITIPIGSVESVVLTVTRTPGTTGDVTVNIGTLPSLPRKHYGYALTKSDSLPLYYPLPQVTRVRDRTPAVRDAIVRAVPGVNNAADVTEAHLTAITSLDIRNSSIHSLMSGDFDGLTTLTHLDLHDNLLGTLPSGIFDELIELKTLYLDRTSLTSLPSGIFDKLTKLTTLKLAWSNLRFLQSGVFDNNTALTELWLQGNILGTLPSGIFDELTELTKLYLFDNSLPSLPSGIFDELTALTDLRLSGNELTSLPEGIFDGLTGLTGLRLGFNAVNPLPLKVSLEKVGTDQLKAVAPAGAPFDIVLPLNITNGSISGGVSSITITTGNVESGTLTVTRTTGTTAAVTVNIGSLPGLPTDTDYIGRPVHSGYELVKSDDLPLEVISTSTTPNVTTPTDTPRQESGVNIPDSNLRAKIESALSKTSGATISTMEMGTLSTLNAQDSSINDLTGLETATNLTMLKLGNNTISNISALSSLTNLTELQLWDNQISNLSDLSGLTNLTKLYLWGNSISDISHLSGLTSLTELRLGENSISNISAVSSLTNLTYLSVKENAISDISAVSGLTNLTQLQIGDNTISNIAAVSNLTNLEWLDLPNNNVSDISTVQNLTSLVELYFQNNAVSDLSPLVTNTGFDEYTEIDVSGNPLSYPSIYSHIPALQAKDVYIEFDNRVATSAVKISGDTQQGDTGATLADPFVVEVKDADSVAFIGVPVTFAVTAGGGTLSTTSTTTDANGRAESTLTLGNTDGANTVSVSVTGITQTITFTATATTPVVVSITPVGDRTSQVAQAILGVVRLDYSSVSTYADITAEHLTAPTALYLNNKSITSLKSGDFDGLTSVSELRLQNNRLTSLPADIFRGLTSLSNLNLFNNQLNSLPDGIFEGLTSLTTIRLGRNTVDPLPFPVSLEKVAEGQFKAVAPAGALFAIVLPVTVMDGSITGGATMLTIPQGSVASGTLSVTRTPGTTTDVTVDIGTLPSLPRNHYGYALTKSDGLPLTVISGINTAPVFSDGTAVTRTVAENTAEAVNIGSPITATDAENDTLTYTLSGTDSSAFDIENTTGQLKTKAALDYETKTSYTVTITVSDGNGGTDNITVTINVTDVNEQETSTTTYNVGDDITTLPSGFWIPDRTANGASFQFSNGQVTITFNNEGYIEEDDTTYTCVDAGGCQIVDGQVTQGRIEATTGDDVPVSPTPTVTNNAPVFSDGATTTRSVAENTASAQNIGTAVAATDAEGHTLTYTLSGTEASSFDIESTTGQLKTKTALDYETKTTYTVTITVSDGNLTDTITVTINVTDINELPVAAGVCQVGDVLAPGESCTYPDTEAVFSVLANGKAQWNIPNLPPLLAFINQVSIGDSMSISTTVNGQAYNFVAEQVQDTSWEIKEIGESTTTSVNTNTSPSFVEGDSTTRVVLENTQAGVNIGSPVRATDTPGDLLAYTLGGVDADSFEIDSSGQLKTKAPIDYETKRIYSVTITVDDEQLSDTITVIISVIDVNDTVISAGFVPVADRTPQVRDAIVAAVPNVTDAADVTESQVAAITALNLRSQGISSLITGDFSGMTSLTTLNLFGNQLSSLPPGIFTELTALSTLRLGGNVVDPLPLIVSLQSVGIGEFKAVITTGAPFNIVLPISVTGGSISDGTTSVTIPQGSAESASFNVTSTSAKVSFGTLPGLPANHFGYMLAQSNVCNRTTEVADAIAKAVGVSDCSDVTETDLATITTLDLSDQSIASISSGDFDGMLSLKYLILEDNNLTSLPSGIFDDLVSLRELFLSSNKLTSIPGGIFSNLTSLTHLYLQGNDLSSLPNDAFDGLSSLVSINLQDNGLTSLPGAIFDGIPNITSILLSINNLTSIPNGLFEGLTQLSQLHLYVNSVDPLPMTVSLQKVGTTQFKAVAPNGAPFAIVLPITITNGRITNGATTITIPKGKVESQALTVTRTTGTVDTVTANIGTLPTIPVLHNGYALVKGTGLPIEVIPPLNSPPVFSDGATTTRTVAENTVANTNIGAAVAATDRENDTLTYTLGGTDAASFDVDSSTGQLKTKVALDYETKNSYTVTLTVSDGKLSDTITVTINVSDVNEAPIFTDGSSTTRTIVENLGVGVNIGTVVGATDDDADTLTYSLSGADASSFDIDSTTGQLKIKSKLDFETRNAYTVTVTVSDDSLKATINVTINVSNVNEAPEFVDGNRVTRKVAENTDANVNIGDAVSATDPDNDTLTYTLGGTDAASFDVDSETGQLITKGTLDYETKRIYTVILTVSDGTFTDTINVTINITDVDEAIPNRAPVFTAGSTATRSIAENTGAGINIGTVVSATDEDGNTLTYTLSGTDAASFDIDAVTGQLKTKAALDFETKNTYTVIVTVSDGTLTDTITITINITNVDEPIVILDDDPVNNAPVFVDDSTTRSVSENTEAGVNIGAAISATDEDDDTLTYTLGGTDAAAFDIDSETGQLKTKAALDYETKDTYTVTVTVSDTALTDTITVTINITDIDETVENRSPIFRNTNNTNRSVPENSPAGINIGSAVDATDADVNTLTYTLGGTDAASFDIDSGTGQLKTKAALDYETKNTYTVTVTVSDGDLSNTITVIINVTDLPESDDITGRETELMPDDLLRTAVRSALGLNDGDELTQQGIAKLTSLSTSSKAISDLTGLEYATALTSLSLQQSQLSDISSLQNLTNLTSLNLSFSYLSDISSLQNLTNLTSLSLHGNYTNDNKISDITALGSLTKLTSLDLRNNQISDISTLSSLTELDTLRLNQNQISDVSALQNLVKLRTLALNENSIMDYAPLRTLKAQNPFVDIDITIPETAPTKNNAPTFTAGDSTTRAIAENTAAGVNIGTAISATDADNDTLTYNIVQDNTEARAFDIDSTNGQLKTKEALDYETKRSYSFRVFVTDNNGGNDSISVTVNITDVVEDSPISSRTTQVRDAIVAAIPGVDSHNSVTLTHLSRIQYLRIENKSITSLKSGDFANLTSLATLLLGGNDISSLPSDIFDGLSSLSRLGLNGNDFTSVDEDIFDGLSSLTYVTFFAGSLTSLPGDIFDGLSSLETIDLRSNDLSSLPEDVFDGLSSLTDLSLGYNDISSLQSDVFDGLSSLESLGLSSNDISSLPSDVFDGLTSLESLDLSDNDISSLSSDIFDDLSSLETLDFRNNSITDVSELEDLTSLTTLYLNGNSISDYAPLRALKKSNSDLSIDITIPGVANNAPVFTEGETATRTVNEAYGVSQIKNPLSVTDADNDSLTFSFSGTDTDTFYVVETSDDNKGHLRLRSTAQLDYDTKNSYTITVTVSDGKGGSDSIIVTINITQAPVFTDGTSTTRSIAEETAAGVNIGEPVSATDAESSTLSYSIITTEHANVFSIDSSTGQLKTRAFLDHETTSSYTIKVRVQDSDGGGGSAEITVTINVTNVDESSSTLVSDRTEGIRDALVSATGKVAAEITAEDLARITQLVIWDKGITSLKTGDFSGLVALTRLNLMGNTISTLPSDIFDGLSSLTSLTLETSLTSYPSDVFDDLTSLTDLDIYDGTTTSIPEDLLDSLTSLTDITIGFSAATSIPEDLFDGLTSLVDISLSSFSAATSIPEGLFDGLTSLSSVRLHGFMTITSVPSDLFDGLTSLTSVGFTWNRHSFPDDLFDGLSSLTSISFNICLSLSSVPEELIDGLTSLTTFSLTNSGSISLPVDAFDGLSSLTSINLSGNRMTSIPEDLFDGLSSLTSIQLAGVSISDDNLTSVPSDLFNGLSSLSSINLRYHKLRTLPSDLFDGLSSLSSVSVHGNPLTDYTPLKTLKENDPNISIDINLDNNFPVFTDGESTTRSLTVNPPEGSNIGDPISATDADNDTLSYTITAKSTNIIDIDGSTGQLKTNSTPNNYSLNDTYTMTIRVYDGNSGADFIDVTITVVQAGNGAPSAQTTPIQTELLSNFPNPFNPETWIPYQLAKTSEVTITIFDIRGRVVRTLILGSQTAGVYQSRSKAAHWDGRNHFAEKVATGLYFYTFKAGDFSATRKMLIRK